MMHGDEFLGRAIFAPEITECTRQAVDFRRRLDADARDLAVD